MKRLIVIAALLAASGASAQRFTMMVDGDGRFQADWKAVTTCAKKPYPALNPDDRNSREMSDIRFHDISGCRWALVERQAVWLEAGRPAESNPWPPVPMDQPDDFKTPLICDYSGLDKRGIGFIKCGGDD